MATYADLGLVTYLDRPWVLAKAAERVMDHISRLGVICWFGAGPHTEIRPSLRVSVCVSVWT